MNIEKLTCCLAKPMNAIRDLVSKVNEIITVHNDHLENHPSGGGGGSADTSMCVDFSVLFKEDGSTEISTETPAYSIADAFQERKNVYARIKSLNEGDPLEMFFLSPLAYVIDTEMEGNRVLMIAFSSMFDDALLSLFYEGYADEGNWLFSQQPVQFQ